MAAVYPTTVKTFTTKTNKVDLVDAAHINTLQEEVVATQSAIGTYPNGSCVDLTTRLAVSLGTDGAIRKGTAFPVTPTPIDGQMFYRTDQDILYINDGTDWDSQGQSLSNLVFEWHRGSTYGTVTSIFVRNANTFSTMYLTKWRKIAGISTVTVQAEVITDTSNTSTPIPKFSIGTVTGTGKGLQGDGGGTTRNWTSWNLDISGLGNGTFYNVVVELKDLNAAGNCYILDLIANAA